MYSQTCLCDRQVGPVLSCFLDCLALLTQLAICQLEMPAPSLPQLSAFPAPAQPRQLYWLEVFNEFFIHFWLWNLASYCCRGLAFPFIHYQRAVIKTSHVTLGLLQGGFPQRHVITWACWLTIKELKAITSEGLGENEGDTSGCLEAISRE